MGLARHQAVLHKRLNPGVGQVLASVQLDVLRDRLAPVYTQLVGDPAVQGSSRWRW